MEQENVIKIGESQTSFLRRALTEALDAELKKKEGPEKRPTPVEPTLPSKPSAPSEVRHAIV
ncbi:MAG: hypothetical protein JWM16_597 [Verrucomicrobiales bacterium]|nr:hypothetical protein [Verrucomicrobiales bacterium]